MIDEKDQLISNLEMRSAVFGMKTRSWKKRSSGCMI